MQNYEKQQWLGERDAIAAVGVDRCQITTAFIINSERSILYTWNEKLKALENRFSEILKSQKYKKQIWI